MERCSPHILGFYLNQTYDGPKINEQQAENNKQWAKSNEKWIKSKE